MDASNVITYSYGCVIYCCCYIRQTTMAFATDHSIVLWDFVSNTSVTSLNLTTKASPVLIKMVTSVNGTATMLLQDKMGAISILTYDEPQRHLQLTNQYSIQILGFTKIALDKFIYNSQGKVHSVLDDHFCTLHYPDTIQKKRITDGSTTHSYNVECEFADATFLLRFDIDQVQYLLIAEEGAVIKQYQLNKCVGSEADLKAKLVLPSKEQIKIVLAIEPTNNYQAILCLRNDQMAVIDLTTLRIQRRLNYNQFRLIKLMPSTDNQQIYAVAGKNQIGFLINSTAKACQKLHTTLVMDMDICPYGALGVTQQGKIWFLSLP